MMWPTFQLRMVNSSVKRSKILRIDICKIIKIVIADIRGRSFQIYNLYLIDNVDLIYLITIF